MSVSRLTTTTIATQLPFSDLGHRGRAVTPPLSPKTPAWSPITQPFSPVTTTSAHQNSPPELPTWASISISNLPPSIGIASLDVPKYEFRLGPRNLDKVALTTWLDQDATGTYDPTSKQDPWLRPPSPCIPSHKRPRLERPFGYLENRAKRPKTFTWQRGRYEGKRLIATFTFISDTGIAALKAYGTRLDNWPGVAFTLPNGDPDWESWWNSHQLVPDSEACLQDTYDLRGRTEITTYPHNISNDGICLEDVTLGHPAARGCKACFELGHPCPLREEGTRYPCSLCQEDRVDCELIMEPQVKGRCTACAKRKVVCSFLDDGGIRGPCKQCKDSSIKCIAGPKNGRTRTGPSLDTVYSPETDNDLGRSFVSCFQCRTAKRWCSLQDNRQVIPCNRCRKSDISCTFEPVARRNISCRTTRRHDPGLPATNDKALAFPIAKRNNNPKSSTKVITTKLAHPIKFNYQPDCNPSESCHWCDDLVYGLLGLGEANIEVIDYHDGQGYVEVGDGHTAAGHLPSRMCDTCTLQRIIIAACRIHELEPVEGMDPMNFDFQTFMDHMMPGKAKSAPFLWCSVCPAPAFFRCCKKMDLGMIKGQGDEEIDGGGGCGLVLCEYCAVSLIGEHNGNLGALIDRMTRERADDGFGLRADVDFLHPQGELLRRMDIQ
ncbi:MAG: hypothetical protein Q9217_000134 [Psora testacea]